jgi:hypothetical protein
MREGTPSWTVQETDVWRHSLLNSSGDRHVKALLAEQFRRQACEGTPSWTVHETDVWSTPSWTVQETGVWRHSLLNSSGDIRVKALLAEQFRRQTCEGTPSWTVQETRVKALLPEQFSNVQDRIPYLLTYVVQPKIHNAVTMCVNTSVHCQRLNRQNCLQVPVLVMSVGPVHKEDCWHPVNPLRNDILNQCDFFFTTFQITRSFNQNECSILQLPTSCITFMLAIFSTKPLMPYSLS